MGSYPPRRGCLFLDSRGRVWTFLRLLANDGERSKGFVFISPDRKLRSLSHWRMAMMGMVKAAYTSEQLAAIHKDLTA